MSDVTMFWQTKTFEKMKGPVALVFKEDLTNHEMLGTDLKGAKRS